MSIERSTGGRDACGRWAGGPSGNSDNTVTPLASEDCSGVISASGPSPAPAIVVAGTSAFTPGSDPSSPHPASNSTSGSNAQGARRRIGDVPGMAPIVAAAPGAIASVRHLDPSGDAAMGGEHLVQPRLGDDPPLADHGRPGDDRVASSGRPAPQPGLDRVGN